MTFTPNAADPQKAGTFTIEGIDYPQLDLPVFCSGGYGNGQDFQHPQKIKLIYGDINADGLLTTKDVLAYRKHLTNQKILTDLVVADVDMSGTVTTKDLLLVRKSLAGYKITLGIVQPTTTTESTTTILTAPSRTTNSSGNPSQKFIDSLKGFELKIFYPYSPEISSTDTQIKDAALAAQKAVCDEFGVTITQEGKFDNYNETLTAKLASRTADSSVYSVQNFNYVPYMKNNFMADLSNAMVQSGVDFSDPWYLNGAADFFNVNNKQLAWISNQSSVEHLESMPNLIVYNNKLINDAGLTSPRILATNGKWTRDTLVNYAKKLTTSSAIGFGCTNATNMLQSMVRQQNLSLINIKKGQIPTSDMQNENIKQSLSTLQSWCKDNKICNTFSNQNWTYGKTEFAKGNIAMLYCGYSDLWSLGFTTSEANDIGVVQFPTAVESKTFTNTVISPFASFIPAQHLTDAAKILFLQNELYRQNYKCALYKTTHALSMNFHDRDDLSYAINMLYSRGNNKNQLSCISFTENSSAKARVSTITTSVLNGISVDDSIAKYNDAIDSELKNVWDGYKITGNVG